MEQRWQIQQIAAMQYAAAMEVQRQQIMQFQSSSLLGPFASPPFPLYPPIPQPPPPADYDELNEDSDDDEERRTLFCGNLDERVTEEILYEVFLQAGPIEAVRIAKDNAGRTRSFGFVTFVHACTSSYALELMKGLTLFRKRLTINCQDRNVRPNRLAPILPPYTDLLNQNCRESSKHTSQNPSNQPNVSIDDSGETTEFHNPFKQDNPDWVLGISLRDKERISKHSYTNLRPHHHSGPYHRPAGVRSGRISHERDRNRERNRRDYHHSGSSRRSEQRTSSRR